MRPCCFPIRWPSRSAAPTAHASSGFPYEADGDPPSSSPSRELPTPSTNRSARSDAAVLQSPTIVNLTSLEYHSVVHTQSYTEIWNKIRHHYDGDDHDGDEDMAEGAVAANGDPHGASSSHRLVAEILQPDRASIEEALQGAKPSKLTRLVSDYFESSESTSRLCVVLHRSIEEARSIYAPLHDVLDIVPSTPNPAALDSHHHHHRMSQEQCKWVFDTFLKFDQLDNPFPTPDSPASGFDDMLRGLKDLRQQLQCQQQEEQRKLRLLRGATSGSAICLVGTTLAVVVAGIVLATHALVAVAGPLAFLHGPRNPLASRKREVKEIMAQLEDAVQGTYVLDHLQTIRCLTSWLHNTVESDRFLVKLGIRQGQDRHSMEGVVRQLRKNHAGFPKQLEELEEHVCICCAAINRARSTLYKHIPRHNGGRGLRRRGQRNR